MASLKEGAEVYSLNKSGRCYQHHTDTPSEASSGNDPVKLI